jgi:hypothetical protein
MLHIRGADSLAWSRWGPSVWWRVPSSKISGQSPFVSSHDLSVCSHGHRPGSAGNNPDVFPVKTIRFTTI